MFYIFIAILLVALLYLTVDRKYKKFPPGPPKWPIIGSLPSFILAGGSIPSRAYAKMKIKYGNIFGLKMGTVPTVVLNSHSAMMEIAFNDNFQAHLDENDHWFLAKSKGLPVGIFFGSAEEWSETRAVAQKLMRKYGFNSKSDMENLFTIELKEFIDDLKMTIRERGPCISLYQQFHGIFFSLVWMLLTGQRSAKDNPYMSKIISAGADFTNTGTFAGGIHVMYPELIHYFPNWTGYTKVQEICADWYNVVDDLVNKFRMLGTYKVSPENFIEEYLQLIAKTQEQPGQAKSIYTDLHLIAIIQDLFLGGFDTQAYALKFVLRHFLKYPNVQETARKEVDRVVGRNRAPTLDDMDQLVYTQATLAESLRLEPISDIAIRKVTYDTTMGNYDLPKGTMIMCNLYAANIDEAVWENPLTFDPMRFISPKGQLVNTEKVMGFGFGKRKCLGEFLAKRNLLLATATLLQEFYFDVDEMAGVPGDDFVINAFTRDLKPFNIMIKIRE